MIDRSETSNGMHTLNVALDTLLPSTARNWLAQEIARVDETTDPLRPLAQSFAAARRCLGEVTIGTAAVPGLDRIMTPCGALDARGWSCADGGRALLLGAAISRAGTGWDRLIGPLFRDGDEGERVSLIRALCLTPEPCRLLPIALGAGRMTSLRLYGALALDNPYPCCCYPEHDFNVLVLKCLFIGLTVGRITGLDRRTNADLSRMCEDYYEERTLAGRTVPADIWLPLVPHASPAGITLALEALADANPSRRYYAALALCGRRAEPAIGAALAARRGEESDMRITAIL